MRYLFGFLCVCALVGTSPPSASAQGDQWTEQEPALGLAWLEWSDLQWLEWLLEVEQRVEPERPTWPAPPPLSEGSWLRLEVGFAGMRVVPRPPPRPPREVREYSLSRGKRIGIGVGVSLAVFGALAAGIGVASLNAAWE
jgi:hypothetical protein